MGDHCGLIIKLTTRYYKKYWGWAKYHYREEMKPTFEVAKKVAMEALNSCPLDMIRRFINRSWQFMSAYRLGLSSKAAAWAV